MEAAMITGSTLPANTTAVSVLSAVRLVEQPGGPGGTVSVTMSSEGAAGDLSIEQLAQESCQGIVSVQPFSSKMGPPRRAYAAYLRAFNRAAALESASLTPTGTVMRPWKPVEVPAQSTYYSPPSIVVQDAAPEQIFDTVQAFYLSPNKLRDRQIAERITTLYRDALDEDERIYAPSLKQFTQFFLANKNLGFPRITLTPDENIRVRWIRGEDDFVAIEFTGQTEARLVTEIPGLVPPMRFRREPLPNIIAAVQAMGGSFT